MDRETDLDILARTELFRALSREALDEVRRSSSRKRVGKGDVLFHQDEPVTTLYIVVVGRLRALQTTAEGNQVIIRYLGPGEIAGYAALDDSATYPGTVAAVDDSHVIGLSKGAIRRLLERFPQVALNALSVLGTRYRETQLRLRELSTESVERRLARTILRLGSQAGRRTAHGIEIAFPLSRQDLAEMAGTTLHTVSRTLSGWEKDGLVMSGRRRVILCRPEGLTVIAETAP